MYMLKKNNYYEKPKNSTVYTPKEISEKIYEILSPTLNQDAIIFDPCVGAGSLLIPWRNNGYNTIGHDIFDQGFEDTKIQNYITSSREDYDFTPDLVVINPPFNSDEQMRKASKEMGMGSRPLMPELFLEKTIQLFGKNIPIVLFTPYGLRLNSTRTGKRMLKFADDVFPDITSIISLPRDAYQNVVFHSEILIFNTENIKAHYVVDFREKE